MRLAKTASFLLIFFSLTLVVFPAAAQIEKIDNAKDFGLQDGELADVIEDVINAFLGLVALVAAIFLIVGGVFYIISAGDSQRQERAKSTILYAIIGLIVVGLAAVIVNFTLDAVGVGGGGN